MDTCAQSSTSAVVEKPLCLFRGAPSATVAPYRGRHTQTPSSGALAVVADSYPATFQTLGDVARDMLRIDANGAWVRLAHPHLRSGSLATFAP